MEELTHTDHQVPDAGGMPSFADLTHWEGPAIGLMDLDAFFASVEQLDHPEWRGKPVIVGGLPEERGVVSTASYEARPYGVHSAMSSAQAQRLCPNSIPRSVPGFCRKLLPVILSFYLQNNSSAVLLQL